MKVIATIGIVFIVIAALILFAIRVVPQHVYDGFESSKLDSFRWSTQRLVTGSAVAQQAFVRAGQRSLAITVHDGDRYEAASSDGAATERDELMESWWLYARSGRSYVYSFSLNLPGNFPQTSERLVLAQWRELCERKHCEPDRPLIAIRYEDGRLLLTKQHGQEQAVLYQGNEDVRGKWLDFRFVIHFSAENNGEIQVTLNRQPVVRYHGPILFSPVAGYPANGLVYFKTGLYRDALQRPPWTIYLDEYRKDQCPAAGCQ